MRLGIAYRMHFRYPEAVTESQNEVRVRPLHGEFQRVLSYRLTSRPRLQVLSVLDYWGTTVEHLGIRTPHTELELLAEASVETEPRPAPSAALEISALSDASFRRDHLEFLAPSPHVHWDRGDAVERRAASATAGAASVQDMVHAVVVDVREVLTYRQGATEIGTTLAELLAGGAGVCQDFAHLAAGMLRSVGVPARYVSGYLFAADETASSTETDPSTEAASSTETAPSTETASCTETAPSTETASSSEADDVVSVQTHAWIEAALPGWGWWALDPTNGGAVGERHVLIGCGRDYGDVPPVRGAFTGSGTAEVEAEVVIARQVDGHQPGPARAADPPSGTAAVAPTPNWRHQQSQQQQ